MAARCMSRKSAYITLGVGIFIFVISVAVLLIFPTLYKTLLAKDIVLTENSLATDIWKDIPLPLYERLYFFNITNGDAFLRNEEKLNVTEVGPYTYVGKWVKTFLQWNPNGTVSYRETRTYQFVPDMSVGSQDDEVFTLNGPMIIASAAVKKKYLVENMFVSFFLKLESENIIIKKKISELAYDGYEDILIKLAPLIKSNIPYKNGIFSWLYGKNATDDGLFTVFTGADNQTRTNLVNNWNGMETLSFWKGDTCNMINGTSIETGPPFEEGQKSYTFFQSIFCRSLTMDYVKEGEVHGITTKHFEPSYMLFANGSENPDNYCFDLEPGRPSGVLDISPCQFDAPVFLSFPHFHMADPFYNEQINGLTPNSDDHGSFLEIEPVTGLSVNIKIRFQMNLEMERVEGIFQFDNVPKGIFPVFWVELSIAMDEYWANFLHGQLNNPKIIVYTVCGILAFASLVLIICSMVVLYLSQTDEDDPLLDIRGRDCDYSSTTDAAVSQNGQIQHAEGEFQRSGNGEVNKGFDSSPESKDQYNVPTDKYMKGNG